MLNYVTLVLDLYGPQGAPASGGNAVFTPSQALTDIADAMVITAQPLQVPFTGSVPPALLLLATDNGNPQPAGWTWGVSFSAKGAPAPYSFYLPAGPAAISATSGSPVIAWTAGGGLMSLPVGTGVTLAGGSLPGGFSAGTTYYVVASTGLQVQLATTPGGSAITAAGTGNGALTVTQMNLSALTPVSAAPPMVTQFLQLPAGTPANGDVIAATGPGSWEWQTPSDSGGDVTSVFGRTGAVIAESGDYSASQVSGAVQIGGDLGGTAGAPTVAKIQGTAIEEPTGSATQYLDAQGNWSTPAGTGEALSNPMTAVGDSIYGGASGAPQRLAGNTTATRKFLRQTGDGTNSAAPAWDTLAAGDLPAATTSAQGAIELGGGTTNYLRADGTWVAPPAGAVTSVFGRTGVVTATSGDYTAAEVTGAVQVGGDLGGTAAAPTVAKIQGTAVSAPSGGSTHFLNAAGTWAVPAGGGSSGVPGWKNLVGDYGADPTGVTSASSALASACAAAVTAQPEPFGLMVPPGLFKLTAPQQLPWNMTLQGAGATGGDVSNQFTGTWFNIASTFSGGAYVFGITDNPSHTSANGALCSGFGVDGSAQSTGTAVSAFLITGPALTILQNLYIAQMSGWAINTAEDTSASEIGPYGQTYFNITADSCGTVSGGGFNLVWCEDSVFNQLYSIGNNGGPGFLIEDCDNSKFTECNAEWNSNYGYYITGDWQWATGGCLITGSSTDANGQYGFYCDATWTTGGGAGTGPGIIQVTGCHFRRDGQVNTAASAGIALGATTLPILISACTTMPSIGDGGTGSMAPAWGMLFTQATYAQPVGVFGVLAWGLSATYRTGSTNGTLPTGNFTSANIMKAHGNNYAPTYGS